VCWSVCVCVCVCVCVRVRERERERVCECVKTTVLRRELMYQQQRGLR